MYDVPIKIMIVYRRIVDLIQNDLRMNMKNEILQYFTKRLTRKHPACKFKMPVIEKISSYVQNSNRNTNRCENSKLWKKMNRNTFTNTMRNTHTDFEQQAICIQCVIMSWGHDSLPDLVLGPSATYFLPFIASIDYTSNSIQIENNSTKIIFRIF